MLKGTDKRQVVYFYVTLENKLNSQRDCLWHRAAHLILCTARGEGLGYCLKFSGGVIGLVCSNLDIEILSLFRPKYTIFDTLLYNFPFSH